MIKFTDNEILVLKQIVSSVKHSYERGFQCECGHIYEEPFRLHAASSQNDFGSLVCKKCGANKKWHDVKIKTIWCDIRKIKGLKIIEQI